MFRALVSFSGIISMAKDEIREISDSSIVKDLLNAGYIEEVVSDVKEKPKTRKKTSSKK